MKCKIPSTKKQFFFSLFVFITSLLATELPKEKIINFFMNYLSLEGFYYRIIYEKYEIVSLYLLFYIALITHISFYFGIENENTGREIIKIALIHIFAFVIISFLLNVLFGILIEEVREKITPWNF